MIPSEILGPLVVAGIVGNVALLWKLDHRLGKIEAWINLRCRVCVSPSDPKP